MRQIQIKRVYDRASENDGFRILVDRLWPRGIKKENLKMDYWAKELAPSTPLRKWFHENLDGNWDEFTQKYKYELLHSQISPELFSILKNQDIVTLLTAVKDDKHNYIHILKDYLEILDCYSKQ